MSDLDWIKNRLPANHGFTDPEITAELNDNGGIRTLALAALFERLSRNDRYLSESIGDYSYNTSLLLDKAAYWRNHSDTSTPQPTQISFIPATGLDFMTTNTSLGTELG